MYESMIEIINEYCGIPATITLSEEDCIMLAAIAGESGFPHEDAVSMARSLVRAIACGYFTVVREYEQEVNGCTVTLSPYQWERWATHGELPNVSDQVEQINSLIAQLYRLRQRVAPDVLKFKDVEIDGGDEIAMNVVF